MDKNHLPCPEEGCGSSDALTEYANGQTHCFSCGNHTWPDEPKEERQIMNLEDIQRLPILAIPDRGISQDVCETYKVHVELSETTGLPAIHYYPYFNDGQLIGYKKRIVEGKLFSTIGDMKGAELFGQHLCGGGKFLIITEGELDALSAKQMLRGMGKDYNVASLPNGANAKAIKDNLEFIESFEKVVLCFDNDKAGLKAVDAATGLIKPGKAYVCRLPEKDPNILLQTGRDAEFLIAINRAKVSRPDGLVSGKDTWDALMNKPKIPSLAFPEDWGDLNEMTYGVRLGELDTFTSGTSSGKTQLFREIQYHILNNSDASLGIIALEEPLTDSVESLMALDLNLRIQLPDVEVSDADYRTAWENTSGTNRLVYYDHFGSVDDESLINKIRQMARSEDCKYIFLDHLSIVVSEFASEGGERERIDTVMSKLKSLTQELGIWIGLIVHLRKTGSGTPFEEGAVPTLDDLRGSGSIKQLSNGVYSLSRNQQADDVGMRNTSQMHVLKCRFTGRTGPADRLSFNPETGRMVLAEDFEAEKDNEF